MELTDARTAADAAPTGPADERDVTDLEPGVNSYRIVEEMDATGELTLRAPDGVERTVVDSIDRVAENRLADRARGATVRVELSPASNGEGYVAARVLPGSLPAV